MQEADQKELAPLRAQVSKLEAKAQAVSIGTKEEYADAADLVAKLKETGRSIKDRKEAITRPLNEALKSARELFAPLEAQFANAEAIVKGKLLDFKRRADEQARREEAALAARVEKGTLRPETAERKISEVERVETTTHGKVGSVTIRKVRKVRIIDPLKIPREYLIVDEVAVRRDALAGKEISGAEVYEEEVVGSSRSI